MSTSAGRVTTLVPPPGRRLFSVALANDLHVGETVSGLTSRGFSPGFSQAAGERPYATVMAEAMVSGAVSRGAQVLMVAGDLTAAARPGELVECKAALDGFGDLTLAGSAGPGSYVVARGNHDQPRLDGSSSAAPPLAGRSGWTDAVPGVFSLPQGRLTAIEFAGLRMVGLNTSTRDGVGGAIDDAQFADLEAVLGTNRHQPTLVFGHHPVTDRSAETAIAGPTFVLNRSDAARLEQIYAATPGGDLLQVERSCCPPVESDDQRRVFRPLPGIHARQPGRSQPCGQPHVHGPSTTGYVMVGDHRATRLESMSATVRAPARAIV